MNTGSNVSNYNFDNSNNTTNSTSSSINKGTTTTSNNNRGVYTGNTKPTPSVETMDLSFATTQVANESKSILDKIGDFFGDLIDGAKETGAKIVNGAKSIITDGLNGLNELGSNIVSAAATLASNAGSLLSNLATWGLETAKKVRATAAVVGTSIVSGVANIGEGLVDGLTWCGGKVVEGGSWIVGKIAGLFSDEAEQSVMEWREEAKTDVKEFISTDWIGKANDWFYQETQLGQAINESSYLKYDSKLAKGITTATEMVGKIIAATAATFIPGGAVAAPLILGFTSGVGEKSEKLYQENINTTGAQELGIFISGLGEAANWYAQSKLGEGALGLINNIKTAGFKQTGSMIWSGIKSAARNVKTNGVINTLKGAYKSSSFASLKAADNLADSAGIIGDNISDWLTGEEEFNFTNALKASGELVSAWILNMGMDGLSDYLSGASKQTDALIKTTTDLEVDNGSSLGARFDDFTTGKNGTYGVDQGACRRMTYTEVLNSDWLTDPDDFKVYLKEKLSNWSEADLDDAFKTFTEGPRINDKGKEIVIEYIQRNNADYQSAMDTFKKSFNPTQAPDYTKLVQKYIDAGMSEADAIYLLKTIDTTGVCSYAAAANGIAASFADNPQLFKEVFGYDLYKTIDGQQVINSSELLSDLYVYANLDTNGGKLFTMVDGKLTYLNKDFSQQVYLSGSTYTRDDILDGFLKSKSPDLGYTDNIRIFTNQDQFVLRGMDDSTNYTVDDVKKTFNEVLQTNSNVQLGVYRSKNNQFTFYNMDGTVNVTTNSWNEGGGHAVFITGMTDEGVIVSSWGEKLLIKYEDFINNRYNIAWGEISGITPATASSLTPTQGTTKIITDGVGDGQSNLTDEFRSDRYRRCSTYEEFTQSMAENRATQEILDIKYNERLSANLENYKGNDIRYPGNYIGVNGYLRGDTFITNGKPDTSKDFLVEQVIMHCSGSSKPPMTAKQFKKMYGSATTCYKSQKDTAEFLAERIRECPLGENTQFIRGVNWKALQDYGISENDTAEMIKEKLMSLGTYVDKGFSSVCPLLDSDELPAILTGKPIKLVLNVDGSTGAFDLSRINSKEMEVLLQNGLEFNTIDVKNIEGDIYIYMEQVS